MTVLQYCFWATVLLLAYIYFGYPLSLFVLAKWRSRPVHKATYEPPVSILIAAHNEAAEIDQTIENKLALDYPPEKFEMVVVSDGSTDRTDAIVRQHVGGSCPMVTLLRQDPRQGKTAALNMAARHAQGDILVFADANSLYERDAVRKLIRNFHDPSVGYATGRMMYTNPSKSSVGEGSTAFMNYENLLRIWETHVGSVVGVDGGIDAIRRDLYIDMRPDQLPDFVLPLSVVERGYRVVYEPDAALRERALSRPGDEYAMRVRVALRAFWALYDKRKLLNPLRYGIYSWQLISHKILRYLAFVPLGCVTLFNIPLWSGGLIYRVLLVAQLVLYSLAFLGLLFGRSWKGRWFNYPQYFLLLNAACAHALWKFLRGQTQAVWNPRTG